MAYVIDFEEDSTKLTRAMLVQDFRDVHSKCQAVFSLSEEEADDFVEGSFFKLWGTEWEAVSYKKLNIGGGFIYSVAGFPRAICSYVTSKQVSLSGIARAFGINFNSRVSTDLKFEFPLKGIPLGHLLYKLRYNSIEKNLNNLSQAWFIYYDERGLVGSTYSGIKNSSPLELDTDLLKSVGSSYSFVRDYLNVRYHIPSLPSKPDYGSIVGSLIKDKFDFRGMVPGLIGSKYNLIGADKDLFSRYDNLVLVRQVYDTSKSPMPWTLTFGQLL